MTLAATDLSQGNLQCLGLGHAMLIAKIMDAHIGGHKRQSIKGLKAFLTQAFFVPQAVETKCRFMNHLQCQPGLNRIVIVGARPGFQ